MGACTAAPTECSFNRIDDPDKAYCAKIEFISAKEWEEEVKHLQGDLSDEPKESLEASVDKPGDVKNTLDKLRAVYPSLNTSALRTTSPESLLTDTSVKAVLGDVKELYAATAESFSKQLMPFVNSETANGKMKYWPLIKVVRVYTKARALETGAVIVDLVSPLHLISCNPLHKASRAVITPPP